MSKKGYRKTYKRNDLIDTVIDLYVTKGMSRLKVMDYLMTDLGLGRTYASEIMLDARDVVNQMRSQNFGDDIAIDIERFEMIYSAAIADNNKELARKTLVEISKIKGHYVERVEINGINPEAMPDIIHIISGPEDNEE